MGRDYLNGEQDDLAVPRHDIVVMLSMLQKAHREAFSASACVNADADADTISRASVSERHPAPAPTLQALSQTHMPTHSEPLQT